MMNAWRSRGLGAALIVLMTVVAYLPAMRAGFVWDDDLYVTQNPLLTDPDGLRRIWFSAHHQSQYFPLVFTTLRFEREWWGLNPVGYHVVNVLLHAANALLVWALLRRLGLPGAWLAAAVWAVHPVNVESVAWVTELKNTQSTLFYLLALLAWIKFLDKGTSRPWRFYGAALVLYSLALFSKTTACTLPAALVLALWLRKEPMDGRRCLQVAPFVVFGLAMGFLSVWWEAHLGSYSEEYHLSMGALERLLIATRALWFYAGKLIWPTRVAFSYPRWEINLRDPIEYVWLLGCVAVASVLWWRRSTLGRAPVAAAVFFVAALSPLLGFIPLYTFRYSFVADHYQYVASIGLIALFAAAVSNLGPARHLGRSLPCVLSLPILLMLGALTWQQSSVYQNLETLWRDTLAKNPSAWIAHNNLGLVLEDQGKHMEAKEHYEAALRLKADYPEAYNNLGNVLVHLNKAPEAIALYEQAIRVKPDYAEAHNNLGVALEQAGRTEEAIAQYGKALRIAPDYAEAHNNMGVALCRTGRAPEAIRHFEEALRIEPRNARAHVNLGAALRQVGRVQEAVEQYRLALEINPDYAEAHNNLGVALRQAGRLEEAIAQYEQALRLKPDLAEAHYNWGNALLQSGQMPQAIEHYEQALRIRPDYAEAKEKLAQLRSGS